MGGYIAACDRIREALDCAVIIIHHCGIQGTRPRGHTSLTGACDAQLAFNRDRLSNVVMTVECMKDGGSEGAVVVSKLDAIEADELPITSCVVVPTEAIAEVRKGNKAPAEEPADDAYPPRGGRQGRVVVVRVEREG